MRNRARIRTVPAMYRFLLMGGHRGFSSYLRGVHEVSTTVGYATAASSTTTLNDTDVDVH
jgi:hypothetical protein